MGANESAAGRSNGTTEEEEQQQQRNNRSSIGGATAIAATAGVAVAAAWGLSRVLSNNTVDETQETSHQRSTWSPRRPSGHGFKLNTDGACRPPRYVSNTVSNTGVQRGPSGYGGVLRDHNNGWVKGFMGFIGESDCLTAEFHGILKGLELLDKLNLQGAILETDSQAAHQWVNHRDDRRSKSEIVRASWHMITECRRLTDKNDIDIQLVSRDDNKYADKLANMAIEGQVEYYVEIKDLPHELKLIARARSAT